ncbi:MAG: hypothetical protein ACKVG9_09100, partial [Rhodospirillales bacterium]
MGDGSEPGSAVIVFSPDGYYIYMVDAESPDAPDGIEEGTYSWDQISGQISAIVLADSNGIEGFSDKDENLSLFVSVTSSDPSEEDLLTIKTSDDDLIEARRITEQEGSIYGPWGGGLENSEWYPDQLVFFFDNGYFISASQIGRDPELPEESEYAAGMERGTFTWDPESGLFAATFEVDTNVNNGFSGLEGATTVLTLSQGILEITTDNVIAGNLMPLRDLFDDEGDGEGKEWIEVGTDTNNELLEKDEDGHVRILDGDREMTVTNLDGFPLRLADSDSGTDGSGHIYSHSTVPYAVANNSLASGQEGYILAIKRTSTEWDYDANELRTHNNWEIYNLNSEGVLEGWEDVDFVDSSIIPLETAFGQDMDGDSVVGLNLAALIPVSSDTVGEILKSDDGGAVYILSDDDDEQPTLVVTGEGSDGEAAQLTEEYQWSWNEEFDDNKGTYTQFRSRIPYAVTMQQDQTLQWTYLMIFEQNNRLDFSFEDENLNEAYVPEIWSEYIVYSVSIEGVLDWASEEWRESVLELEPLFDQDFDGDGSAGGFTLAGLQFIGNISEGDSTSLRLVKEGVYEGTDPTVTEGAIYIVSGDFSNGRSVADGSEASIKVVEEWGGIANIEYTHTWNLPGEVPGEDTMDGTSTTSVLKVVELDQSLKDEVVGAKYILVRQHKESVIYTSVIEGSDEIRTDEEIYLNYDALVLTAEGAIIGNESYKWFSEIEDVEKRYAVDLNQDGSVGRNPNSILFIETDTAGVRLRKTDTGGLFVSNEGENLGDSPLPIVDEYGNYPEFGYTYSGADYTHSETPLAIEEKIGGGYWLAIKVESTNSYVDEESGEKFEESNASFKVISLNSELVVNWGDEMWVESIL